jgi:hypothetical protein
MGQYERGCVQEKPPYLGIEKPLRETERGRKGRRLLHNFHFLSSTLKVMFYLTGSSLRGEK